MIEVEHGRSLTLHDMLRDNITFIVEESVASKCLVAWDCIAVRIIDFRSKNYIFGSLLQLQPQTAQSILNEVEDFKKFAKRLHRKNYREKHGRRAEVPPLCDDTLISTYHLPEMITIAWTGDLLTMNYAPMLPVQNEDGEPMVLCDVRFPIEGDRDDIIAALVQVDDLAEAAESDEWYWLGDRSSNRRSANHTMMDRLADFEHRLDSVSDASDKSVLGVLSLHPEHLGLVTNSIERGERAQEFLNAILGKLVGPSQISISEFDITMDDDDFDEENERFEMEETIDDTYASFEDYYRKTLDTSLPVFNGKTPRQAARSKKRRNRVIRWLKDLENTQHFDADQMDIEPHDMKWIWEELKLERPGRRSQS